MTTTTARRLLAAATTLGLGAALAACADDPAPTSTATTTVSATPTPTGTPSPTPTPTGTAPTDAATPGAAEPTDGLDGFAAPGTELTSEGDASLYVVTGVRTGEHEGYDRVVYQLEGGTGTPGYRVRYVERAVEDPSGAVRQVDGDAILQVTLLGTTYPTQDGLQEFSQDLRPDDGDVEHVVRPLTFEGMTDSFVGVDDGPRAFRVLVLDDPVRVVVDVEDR
ncbi:hypothetical protein LFM56_12420 [Cellulomonas iranensis]|uniref:AMIN-like domain-containing (lipo)protein n=1 Tax=Cellulomonas iranensis TaxID=76862 RepID=UPI001CF21908|nr:hypothetical protein [Cellulomonas iranensis]UCN13706.1 hypothetical protein LFM56_12420 [Cellulomonas iranensis]